MPRQCGAGGGPGGALLREKEQKQEIPSRGNVQGCLSGQDGLQPPSPPPLPPARFSLGPSQRQAGSSLAECSAEACAVLTWPEQASSSSGRKAVAGTCWKECSSGANTGWGERTGAHSQRPTCLGRALISPEVLGSRLCVVTTGLQCLRGVGEEHGGPCCPSWGPADSGHRGMFMRAGRAPRDSQSRGTK